MKIKILAVQRPNILSLEFCWLLAQTQNYWVKFIILTTIAMLPLETTTNLGGSMKNLDMFVKISLDFFLLQ